MTSIRQRLKQHSGQKRKDTSGSSSLSSTPAANPTDSASQTANALQDQTHLLKSTVYTSIEEVTMDRFIACVCDNDLKTLVITGEPSDEELQNAWLSIKSQHIENLKDPHALHQVDMTLELVNFEWKCWEINTLISLLKDKYEEDVVKSLRRYGFKYPFTEDSYTDDIDKVRAKLGSEGLEYASLREQLHATGDNSSKPVKETYYMTITALQKHFGLCHGLSPMRAAKELTVYEFGFSLKEYNKQARANNKGKDVNAGYK